MRVLNIFSKIAFIGVFVLSAVTLRASMLPEDWPAMGRFPSAVQATSDRARAFVEALNVSDDFIRNPEKHLDVWPRIMGKENFSPVDILNFMKELQIALTSLDPLTPALAEGMGRLATGEATGFAQRTATLDEAQALLNAAYLVGQSGENVNAAMASLHQHWQNAKDPEGKEHYQLLAWAIGAGAQLPANEAWYAVAGLNANALLGSLNNHVNAAVDALWRETVAKAGAQASARWISYRADRIALKFPSLPVFHTPARRAMLRQFGPQTGKVVGWFISVLGKVTDKRLQDATFQRLAWQFGPQAEENVRDLITALRDVPEGRLQDATFQALVQQVGPQMGKYVGWFISALGKVTDKRLQDATFQALVQQVGPQMGTNVGGFIFALGNVAAARLQDATFQALVQQVGPQIGVYVAFLIDGLELVPEGRLHDPTFQDLVRQFGPQVGGYVTRLIIALGGVPLHLLPALSESIIRHGGAQAFFQRVPAVDFSINLTSRRFSATSTAEQMTAFVDQQWRLYEPRAADGAAAPGVAFEIHKAAREPVEQNDGTKAEFNKAVMRAVAKVVLGTNRLSFDAATRVFEQKIGNIKGTYGTRTPPSYLTDRKSITWIFENLDTEDRDNFALVVSFLKDHSEAFSAWLTSFLEESKNAYGKDKGSCVAGMRQRIVMALRALSHDDREKLCPDLTPLFKQLEDDMMVAQKALDTGNSMPLQTMAEAFFKAGIQERDNPESDGFQDRLQEILREVIVTEGVYAHRVKGHPTRDLDNAIEMTVFNLTDPNFWATEIKPRLKKLAEEAATAPAAPAAASTE